MEKSASIRRSIRKLRREIPQDVRLIANARICQSFQQLTGFKNARRVAGYLAFDGEADPVKLMKAAVEQGKQVFVPSIVDKHQPLLFIPWVPDIDLTRNRFGIEEPDVPKTEWIAANQLDFVINPLVAFDRNCHRLGVGGGYYDRTFQFLNSKGSGNDHCRVDSADSRWPILAGFAFEIQRTERIERRDWDVVLDWVVTERTVYRRFR